MVKRKGFDQSWFRIVQAAEKNKQSFITASILLYAGFYILVGVGGINFQIQPAIGYVDSISNSNCPAGSMWIEGNSLHYCDGNIENFVNDDSGDSTSLIDGSSSGPAGAVWIEGSNFHWIDTNSNEYAYTGGDTGNNPSASAGSVWLEEGRVHYIDENGNERVIRNMLAESFESYSAGTTPSSIAGWSAGADCGTCEVSSDRAADGSMSFYQSASSGTDDWQDMLIKDISSEPIRHEATLSFEYWEQSSPNWEGNLWARACDGTNIAGVGTENPQFEGVTGSSGEVVNYADGTSYQEWTYAEMKIDLDSNTVDFLWEQSGGGYHRSTGHTIPSGKDICTVGVGPGGEWYIDDIKIRGY